MDAGLVHVIIMGSGGCRVTGGSNHQTNNPSRHALRRSCHRTSATAARSALPSRWERRSRRTAPASPANGSIIAICQATVWWVISTRPAVPGGHRLDFDSLLCACLPCRENPNAVGVVGEFCNPGDRVCGPEPSKAPANKICFSGVGDYTFTTGRKTVKAVFRVDIEDRGEGNSHSSTQPLDRYRIRMWILDPSCGRSPDPDAPENMVIRFAASADPVKIANLATTEDLKVNIPPDIDDGGNMTQGNHQIHKATGAKCKDVVPMSSAVDIDVSTLVTPLMPMLAARSFTTVAQAFTCGHDPAFIYQITITNSGTTTLRDVTVVETTDGVSRETTGLFNLGAQSRLSPGQSRTRYYTNTCPADSITTVTVSGKPSQNATPIFATSTRDGLGESLRAAFHPAVWRKLPVGMARRALIGGLRRGIDDQSEAPVELERGYLEPDQSICDYQFPADPRAVLPNPDAVGRGAEAPG